MHDLYVCMYVEQLTVSRVLYLCSLIRSFVGRVSVDRASANHTRSAIMLSVHVCECVLQCPRSGRTYERCRRRPNRRSSPSIFTVESADFQLRSRAWFSSEAHNYTVLCVCTCRQLGTFRCIMGMPFACHVVYTYYCVGGPAVQGEIHARIPDRRTNAAISMASVSRIRTIWNEIRMMNSRST